MSAAWSSISSSGITLFGGADLVISGNVPQGAGLSSSASLEVAVGTVFQQAVPSAARRRANRAERPGSGKTSSSDATAALWTS
ncbi:hypothetical protein [Escherichia coli]|uniref:GHMP family kinase ATP-binding protein n=1 Tax=Escherichia coli TaxID=562 RepID=UPI0020369BB6|nr:hypothetical protein [Escherichia coli]